jgi:glycosyltransferase involved in cell wall biosynthesis
MRQLSSSNKNKSKISALVLTSNNEKTIVRCLDSLSWCDEILIVDSGSSDQTLKLIADPQASWAASMRLLTRVWTGFKDQRNFSLDHAKYDWVLVIDSDEAVSSALSEKIQALEARGELVSGAAFKVRRQEYFLQKKVEYGSWNPSYQDRFFDRRGVRYVNDIHEYPIFRTAPQLLHEVIDHSPDFGPDQFLRKMNLYTAVEAKSRYEEGQRTTTLKLLSAFFVMFYKHYFYYRGYKDGRIGLIISLLEGVSRVVRHIKLWQLEQEQKR